MRLLAIDTSTWWGGVALLEAGSGSMRLVAETGVWVEDSHAARVLALADAALSVAGWRKDDLDAFAATCGPGSFTGLRVGLGALSGLALATGRPCVGVGTLEAMAEAAGPGAFDRAPMLDAGRGEVYSARYDPGASPPREIVAPWVGEPERALEGWGGAGVVLFGGGAAVHEARLREAGYRGPIGAAPTSVAAGAGRIALARLAAGAAGDSPLEPLYLRPSDAEVKFR